MPAHILSEIDAIFAAKSSSSSQKTKKLPTQLKTHTPIASSSAQVEGFGSTDQNKNSTRRKSSSKRKSPKPKDDGTGVEEVIDPSQAILKISSLAAQKKSKVALDEEELAFRDSRGTRPKTEDGLPIYSVEELKIGLGGDTPACPFDCDCCF